MASIGKEGRKERRDDLRSIRMIRVSMVPYRQSHQQIPTSRMYLLIEVAVAWRMDILGSFFRPICVNEMSVKEAFSFEVSRIREHTHTHTHTHTRTHIHSHKPLSLHSIPPVPALDCSSSIKMSQAAVQMAHTLPSQAGNKTFTLVSLT